MLLGEGGAGVAAGTLLLFGLGLLLVLRDPPALATTLQAEPTPLACPRWAAEPTRHAWVRVTGCREAGAPRDLGPDAGVLVALELPDGTRVGYLSPKPAKEGAAPGSARTGQPEPSRGPVALDAGASPGSARAERQREGNHGPLQVEDGASSGPARADLAGTVQPGRDATAASEDAGADLDAACAACRVLTGTSQVRAVDGAQVPVLLEGRDPRSPRVLLTAFAGLLLMVWALWPVARRWQLVRESDAQAEALRRRHGGD